MVCVVLMVFVYYWCWFVGGFGVVDLLGCWWGLVDCWICFVLILGMLGVVVIMFCGMWFLFGLRLVLCI